MTQSSGSADPGMLGTLLALNAELEALPWMSPDRAAIEQRAAALFQADCRFIVYGSLGPGRPNHGQIADIPGRWNEGWITGDLVARGWGARIGYPAIRWRPDGPRVPAWLLRSNDLPRHWERLDRLEGAEYVRILALFQDPVGELTTGYCYAAISSARMPA